MKRFLLAAALTLSAAPAFAEFGHDTNPYQKEIDDEKRRTAEDADKQYKRTIKQMPDKAPQKADPWGGVRDADPTGAKAKKTH